MHAVAAIFLAVLAAAALVAYGVWDNRRHKRREQEWDRDLQQRLAVIDRLGDRALAALEEWRKEIHEDNAAWEAEASRQMLESSKKS